MRHLIVGFTPFHAYFCERLIEHLDGEIYCLFTKGWPRTQKGYRRLGFFVRSNRLGRAVSYLISLLRFVLWVKWNLWRRRELHVYIPHPSSLLTNFLFFSKCVASVNIYEDGLLNYYDADSSRGRVGLGVRLLSGLCGVPFRNYEGHLAGYDARRVRSVYVSRCEGVVGKKKVDSVVQLCPVERALDVVKGRVLFLDQDVRGFLSLEVREALISKMFDIYPLGEYEYFYKGHHDYRDWVKGMVQLPEEHESLPAELVVPDLRPEIVVSFFSSALLNVSNLFPSVSCMALAAGYVEVSRDGVPCTLADIFGNAGVCCFSKGG